MFSRFCSGANIRAMMKNSPLPDDIGELLGPIFCRVFDGDSRGTMLNDALAGITPDAIDDTAYANSKRFMKLSERTHRMLEERLHKEQHSHLPPKRILREPVLFQQSVTHLARRYSTFRTSLGDSRVIYGDFPHGDWAAGRITHIFVWSQSGREDTVYLVIEPLSPLRSIDIKFDRYRTYPLAGGKLFYNRFTPETALITLDEVVAHFAGTTYYVGDLPHECIHVLPLDRVSPGSVALLREAMTHHYHSGITYRCASVISRNSLGLSVYLSYLNPNFFLLGKHIRAVVVHFVSHGYTAQRMCIYCNLSGMWPIPSTVQSPEHTSSPHEA